MRWSLPDELAVLVDVGGHAPAGCLLGGLRLFGHTGPLKLALVLRERGESLLLRVGLRCLLRLTLGSVLPLLLRERLGRL